MSGSVTLYTTPWCGHCIRLKGQLEREGIAYDVVDIEEHPEAAEVARRIRAGELETPYRSLDSSLKTMATLDMIRRAVGIDFSAAGLLE